MYDENLEYCKLIRSFLSEEGLPSDRNDDRLWPHTLGLLECVDSTIVEITDQ